MERTIAIDIGACYSSVAYFQEDENTVKIIPDELGNNRIPSCIAFKDDEVFIGHAAIEEGDIRPENCFYNIRELLGHNPYDDIVRHRLNSWPGNVVEDRGKIAIKVELSGKKLLSPLVIYALYIYKLKEIASKRLGKRFKIRSTVLTVPAWYKDSQRQSVIASAEMAGIENVKLLNDSVAAAIKFQHQFPDTHGQYLMFHMGGSYTECSIFEFKQGEIIANEQHLYIDLGGNNIDNNIYDSVGRKEYGDHTKIRFTNACEKAKRSLSDLKTIQIKVDFTGKDGLETFTTPFNRSNLEESNKTVLENCHNLLHKVKSQPRDALLIGGSTRLPMIQKLIKDRFSRIKISKTLNPYKAVVQGAAIQAFYFSIKSHVKVNVTCPHNYTFQLIPLDSKSNVRVKILEDDKEIAEIDKIHYMYSDHQIMHNPDHVVQFGAVDKNNQLEKLTCKHLFQLDLESIKHDFKTILTNITKKYLIRTFTESLNMSVDHAIAVLSELKNTQAWMKNNNDATNETIRDKQKKMKENLQMHISKLQEAIEEKL